MYVLLNITILCLAMVCYLVSWKSQQKQSYARAVILLVLGGVILRLFLSCDFFLHEWDERYHALVAKNLLNHFFVPTLYDQPVVPYSIGNWTANHIWLHKQPLPLWSVAASLRIFGLNEIAVRIPSIILSSLGIALMYDMGVRLYGRKTAFIAAFLYSINGLIIELTSGRIATDHIDVFFLFFIQLSVWFIVKFSLTGKNLFNILAGVALGAAILSKWLPALIVLPIWILLVRKYSQASLRQQLGRFLQFCLTCIVIALPWQIYIRMNFPVEAAHEAKFIAKHFYEELDQQGAPFYYYWEKIRMIFGELIYIPLAWLIWKTIKTKDLTGLALCIWIVVPLLFFSFAKTKMQGYIVFISPAVLLCVGEFYEYLKTVRTMGRISYYFRGLVLISLIALPIRFTLERLKPLSPHFQDPVWVQSLRKLDEQGLNAVLFNYPQPIEAMFYSTWTVYDLVPDVQLVSRLLAEGKTVCIQDDGHLPRDLRLLKGLRIIKLPLWKH